MAALYRARSVNSRFWRLARRKQSLGGVLTGATQGIGYKRLLEWFGFIVEWRLGTDSSAARAICLREGVGKIRHMDLKLLWCQQAVKLHNLKIYKVAGPLNRANIGTKKLAVTQFEEERALIKMIPVEYVEAQSVPVVHAVSSDALTLRHLGQGMRQLIEEMA